MDRPISPTSIMETIVPEELSNDVGITVDVINDGAQHAFDYIKQKLNKDRINCGEMLVEFWNYNESDGVLFTSLFCLTLLVLIKCKDNLNEISDNIYSKLMNYSTNLYNTKIDLF
tara:strand:+ start:688 stop:1032 length:345 start_codon:yes stop_codon:yes gene_type:complete